MIYIESESTIDQYRRIAEAFHNTSAMTATEFINPITYVPSCVYLPLTDSQSSLTQITAEHKPHLNGGEESAERWQRAGGNTRVKMFAWPTTT